MIEWTAEKIAQRSTEEVKTLRDNATKRGNQAIVDLCEADLLRRKPARAKSTTPKELNESRAGHYVSEFHFVCPNEIGVTKNPDGSVWTGTWVVAVVNAEAGKLHGSLVALHATKADSSYLQGRIKDWRKMPREPKYAEDQLVKTEFGIDFLFEPTNESVPWKGDGSGEKGYAWAAISSLSVK